MGVYPPWRSTIASADTQGLSERSGIRGSVLGLAGAVARPAVSLTSRTVVAGADAVLASNMTREIVDRVLASQVIDVIGRGIAEHRVLERLIEPSSAGGALDRLVHDSLASPVTERIAVEIIDSELLDQVVARLLLSDDLWLLVDEIAASPAVTAAISRQGLSMADQFAEVVRGRSERADDRLEGAIKRLLRRNGATPDSGLPAGSD